MALNILVILLCLGFGIFVWSLTGYHFLLILTGQTTREYLKNYKNLHPSNPFHASFIRNL